MKPIETLGTVVLVGMGKNRQMNYAKDIGHIKEETINLKIKGNIDYKVKKNELFLVEKVEKETTIDKYDITTGECFVECVELGFIISDDGVIANIILDNYNTNLELENFDSDNKDKAVITLEQLSKLYKEHTVLINWINK